MFRKLNKFSIMSSIILLMMLGNTSAADDGSIGEPDRNDKGPNPLKNVYFGEQHMHTRTSFDAFTAGVTGTWDDAYNFAKGKEIKLSTTGKPMKRRTPYDCAPSAIVGQTEGFE